MVKQSKPNTATEWIKRRCYGSSWGIHSPEIIKSPFDSIMHSYMRMAYLHRQMYIDKQYPPQVHFNEYGEIVKVSYVKDKFGRPLKYWGGKELEDWYRDLGFFFEGEKY